MDGIHRRRSESRRDSGCRLTRAAGAGSRCGIQRFVHDLADGAGAAATLGAAAEAAIDLPGRARPRLRRDGGADIVVAQNVAGADDHEWNPGRTIDTSACGGGQNKSTTFIGCLKSKPLGIPGFLQREAVPPLSGRPTIRLSCHVGQRFDDAVDRILDQGLVVALPHHPDHRLGAGRPHDQTARFR
jgi:hypothetical protein